MITRGIVIAFIRGLVLGYAVLAIIFVAAFFYFLAEKALM